MAQLLTGTKIWGTGTIVNDLLVGGIIYDSSDTTKNSYIQPSTSSKITILSARGVEVNPNVDSRQVGVISVARGGITASNSATFYGLYSRTSSYGVGIGIDSSANLWFGRASTGGNDSVRTSNLFYSDNNGNVYAGTSFRTNKLYSSNNSAYFLDFTTTATSHTILSNAVSTNLIGYDPEYGVYFGGTSNKYISNGTDTSTGPLWINDGVVSRLVTDSNLNLYTTTTFTTPVLINLRNNDSTGITATTHLTFANPGGTSSGIYWRFGNTSDVRASIRANDQGDIFFNAKRGEYKFQQDSGTSSTVFSNSSTSFMSVGGDGIVSFTKDIYAKKMFDSDNSNFFIDPSSTSTISQLSLLNAGTAGTWTDVIYATATAGGTYISANRAANTNEVGYKWMTAGTTVWTNYLPESDNYTLTWRLNGVKQYTMNSAGTLAAVNPSGSSMQAVTFADVNNGGYYIKPSGYSYISSLVLGGGSTANSTGTGLRIFTPNSDAYYSTLFWNNWNWQTDGTGNATLWIGTTTRTLTVTGAGNLAINQKSIPSDVDMKGGISISGSGTTQLSIVNGSTSGFAVRVSDVVFGDFSLYDKAQGSWLRAINAREGKVGINTPANIAYGLTVGGDIAGSTLVSSYNSLYRIDLTGTTVLNTLNAVQYGWNLNTGTGISSIANNTFETAAVFGSANPLGSGSLIDLLMWKFPITTETYNGSTSVWSSDATNVNELFNGQNSLNNIYNSNYSLPANITTQGVRFTWNGFNNRNWDALLIVGNSIGMTLTVSLESATQAIVTAGGVWTSHVNNVSIDKTQTNGFHYLRTRGTSSGAYFRLTILGTGAQILNLYNISLLGTKGGNAGFAKRLLNWDTSKNISTYGNITTNIVYDASDSAYFLALSTSSNFNNATFARDIVTQGQGRFTGWQGQYSTSTKILGTAVEVGVAGDQGYIYSLARSDGNLTYKQLNIIGNLIYLAPQNGNKLLLGGSQWQDADNATYYVKPSTSTILNNLSTFGAVQMVNLGGASYNENIRLPRANDGIAMIALATDKTGAGSTVGQWNIYANPLGGNVAWTGQLIIGGSAGVALYISSSTNDVTFSSSIYAARYYGNPSDLDNYYSLYPPGTSYLSTLKVGTSKTTAYDVLTLGPNDLAHPYYTYAHTYLGDIDDPGYSFNDRATLGRASFVGSLVGRDTIAPRNSTPIGTAWYTMYAARHRGGYSDGQSWGSQIVIPMTFSPSEYPTSLTRLFYRTQYSDTWQNWSEVMTIGSINQGWNYNIYVAKIWDSIDTKYYIVPSGTSKLLSLDVYYAITSGVTGTPTTARPYLGSAEWVIPTTAAADIKAYNSRAVYRSGIYNWWNQGADNSNAPTQTRNLYQYMAGIGFGYGAAGSVEIAASWLPSVYTARTVSDNSAAGIWFRSLSGFPSPAYLSGWSKWTQILESTTHPWAAAMDQYVRKADSPTFANLNLTEVQTFSKQIVIRSILTDTNSYQSARYIVQFASGAYGGFGMHYGGSVSESPYQSFRLDAVSVQADGTGNYAGSDNVNLWIGGTRVISNSGQILKFDLAYPRNNTSYYIRQEFDTSVKTLWVHKLLGMRGTTAAQAAIAWIVNGSGRYGQYYGLTTELDYYGAFGTNPGYSSGITNPSFSQSELLGVPNLARYGSVTTYGYGLSGYGGYAITAEWGYRGAQFLKAYYGHWFSLRGDGTTNNVGQGSGHWAIVGNNLDDGSPRITLNSTSQAIDYSYGVKVIGTLYATGNVYAYSDRRKKRDIITIENGLDTVLKLRGVYYYRIDPDPTDIDRREMGVIAQEVLEELPEAVKYSKSSDEYSVNYGNMAGIFIEAIKDLKKQIDDLKTELGMLKDNK